jgi:hypothetical protein
MIVYGIANVRKNLYGTWYGNIASDNHIIAANGHTQNRLPQLIVFH